MTASERDLLELAAEQAQTNLSDFIHRKALEAAELAVLELARHRGGYSVGRLGEIREVGEVVTTGIAGIA